VERLDLILSYTVYGEAGLYSVVYSVLRSRIGFCCIQYIVYREAALDYGVYNV
jgi:hypothetical protein